MKNGTAPALITTWVCSEVPEAMSVGVLAASHCFIENLSSLVKAQAASNCNKMSAVQCHGERRAHLDHCVVAGEKLHESWNDSTFDHPVDRWVLLFR